MCIRDSFRDERDDGMEQPQRGVHDVHQYRAGDVAIVAAGQKPVLAAFQIPVGQLVPDEAACCFRVLVETQPGGAKLPGPGRAIRIALPPRGACRSERGLALRDRDVQPGEDPLVRAREERVCLLYTSPSPRD